MSGHFSVSLPMNALGITIFNQSRSRTSKPESGRAMTRTMVNMSEWTVKGASTIGPTIRNFVEQNKMRKIER